jgi:hypothetical protein
MTVSIVFGLLVVMLFVALQAWKPGKSVFDR